MDVGLIAEVATAILAVVSYYFSRKYSKAVGIMEDLSRALEDTSRDIEDGKLTPEEVKQLVNDWKKVIDDFIGKTYAPELIGDEKPTDEVKQTSDNSEGKT